MPVLSFVNFWFKELPVSLLKWFFALNKVLLQFFSLPLMLRTFFKPIKNEYREGLVGFSIGMGIAFKSLLIPLMTLLLVIAWSLEIIVFMIIVLFPILTILTPFLPI